MTEHFRFDDRTCAVCRRPAVGYGYKPPNRDTAIAWVCNDPECLAIAKDSFAMKQEEFGRVENMAMTEGGNAGGAYLDSIGKTDLATLTPAEWEEFLKTVIAGYRVALKIKLRDEAPF